MCYLDWQRSVAVVKVGLSHQTTFSVSVLSRSRTGWSFDQDKSRLSQHYNDTIIMELLKLFVTHPLVKTIGIAAKYERISFEDSL